MSKSAPHEQPATPRTGDVRPVPSRSLPVEGPGRRIAVPMVADPSSPHAPVKPRVETSAPLEPGNMPAVHVATEPVEAALTDGRLFLLRAPDSPQAASFRILRHRLADRGDPRTLVVTSAGRGDGKTTCAVNLALALCEGNRARVLLIEANLRHPGVCSIFGMRPHRCFRHQLLAHDPPSTAPRWDVSLVGPPGGPSLHVLAVDPDTLAEGPRLIDQTCFERALSQLKTVGYDYLVIDTPPVLGSADVNLIQPHADGVLLALWAARSSARALREALDQLAPTNILGTVLLNA